MTVPAVTELPCMVQSESDYLEIKPINLPFDYDGRQLIGSYIWRACTSCVECYKDWDTRMEIVGIFDQDILNLNIGIRHMGHNIQDDYLQIELRQGKPNVNKPRMLCKRSFECQDLEFTARE